MDGAPLRPAGVSLCADSSQGDALAGSTAQRLADLVRDLQEDPSHQSVLERTAAAAVSLVPGAEHAGICLLRARHRVAPGVSRGEPAVRLDELQAETGQGPCWDATLHGRPSRIDDLAAEAERWPELAARAAAVGAASVLCLQLRVGSTSLGALKVLGAAPGAFTAAAEQVGVLLATHAAKAIADAHKLENLQLGLAHRDVIGQAKGILMERHRLTADQAFDMLARASQHANRKLHHVAAELAATGELPRR